MIVGFVTSTTLSSTLQDAFLKGLRAAGWEGDPGADEGDNSFVSIIYCAANGNYDDGDGADNKHKELYRAIERLDRNSNINLIVATGGMVSAHAAIKQAQQHPFLLICGADPKNYAGSGKANLRGGWNLNFVANIDDRNAKFATAAGIQTDESCLIWNKNSKMGKDELKAWKKISNYNVSVNDNSDAAIVKAFSDAGQQGAKGILLSADPFFTSRMNTVVDAANKSKLKICYPFGIYKNAQPTPAGGYSIVVGPNPDLEGAYESLGGKVGASLTQILNGLPVSDKMLESATTSNAVILKKKPKPKKRKKTRSKKK